MSTKNLRLLIIALAVIALPILAGAEPNKLDKKAGTEPKAAKVKTEEQTRERERAGATSSPEQKNEKQNKVFRLAAGLQKMIAREISQVKNIVARMTEKDSILAKLEAKGVNTAAIKAKLAEASALADKAQAGLESARGVIASSTTATSSGAVKSAKDKASTARQKLAQAHADVKAAIKNIFDARKMISQIPGIREIAGKAATSTGATTTTATSTN